MSTMENNISIDLTRIPLGRRIGEILEERGEEFSIRKFAEQIGINRETLRIMIAGNRTILPSELEKITKGLDIGVERLKQLDSYKMEQELASLFRARKRTKIMLMRAHNLAAELANLALGATELCESLTNLGRVQFELREYDKAHQSYLLAFRYAEKLYKQYGDNHHLHLVTSLLMLSFTTRKEYTKIEETLHVVEQAFAYDPVKMGFVHYTRMKWYEHMEKLDDAKKHSYMALDYFEQTHDNDQIGKAVINVAHFEYLLGNFRKSADLLYDAIHRLDGYDYPQLVAIKEYAKTALRLGDAGAASEVIQKYSKLASDYPDLQGKLQVMYSIAQHDPAYSEIVCQDVKVSPSVRYLACKQLMNFYSMKGDAESVMLYYKKARILSGKNLLDEEELM